MNQFQRAKSGAIFTGVVLCIAGAVLLFFPEALTKMVTYLASILLLCMGIGQIIGYFRTSPGEGRYGGGLVAGVCLVVAALVIFFRSDVVVSVIPVILGIIIVLSGVAKLQNAIDLARLKARQWTTALAIAILNLVFGVIIIFNPFSTAMALLQFVGIGLIYSGLFDVISILYLSKQMKE